MDLKDLFINFDNYNNRDSMTVQDFIDGIVKQAKESMKADIIESEKRMLAIMHGELKTIKNVKTKKGKGETTKDKKE